jgi:hypothetical protein
LVIFFNEKYTLPERIPVASRFDAGHHQLFIFNISFSVPLIWKYFLILGFSFFTEIYSGELIYWKCIIYIQNLPALADWKLVGSFSERSEKIGRGFIKILEIWQFGFIIQCHKTRIFLFWPKKFFCRFYEFFKNFGLAQKKFVKSRYWL